MDGWRIEGGFWGDKNLPHPSYLIFFLSLPLTLSHVTLLISFLDLSSPLKNHHPSFRNKEWKLERKVYQGEEQEEEEGSKGGAANFRPAAVQPVRRTITEIEAVGSSCYL
ncbi:unnamed protein product [Linum tenue]|uniref:Uncharacterized protein n=1 Tax=Linum tenue TaxID=586396 RepID=A0AAV0NSZ3_9ROSI|nr:unnamed protein product [Linum tenue]